MSEYQNEGGNESCRDLLCGYFGAEAGSYYQRVYDACTSLYRGESDCETRGIYGCDVAFSLTEIWRRMGNAGEPTGEQLARVYEALDAMRLIRITITDDDGLPSNVYLLNLGFYGHQVHGECSIDGVIMHRPPPLAGYSGNVVIDPHGDIFMALIRAERGRRRRRRKSDEA